MPQPAKLDRKQVQIQRLIGSLKFIKQLHPRLSLILHRLSRLMSAPPHEALLVVQATLVAVYNEREIGINYGGTHLSSAPQLGGNLSAHIDMLEPAPATLEVHADATWSDRNVYGLQLTYAGAAVL